MVRRYRNNKKSKYTILLYRTYFAVGILVIVAFLGGGVFGNVQVGQAANKVSINDLETAAKKYPLYENPYYLEGMQGFVDIVNETCKEFSDKQSIEILTMEEALKEAGISSSLRKKILDSEGTSVLTNKDFVCIEEVEKRGLFSTKYYFEVSSNKKEQGGFFYLGKLKNNRPEGEGAIFGVSESGTKLAYAGKFKKGVYEGKGMKFSYGSLGAFIQEKGQYSGGRENGKVTCYYDSEIEMAYKTVEETYLGCIEKITQCYEEIPTEVLEQLFSGNVAERMIVTKLYYQNTISYDTVSVLQPVIKPYVCYSGDMKGGVREGKGKLYGVMGAIWYEGQLKSGTYWGKGSLYYPLSKQVAYKGKFKNGKYHGKGTLYEKDGSVRKKGKFAYEEPDANDMSMHLYGLAAVLTESDVFGLDDDLKKYVDEETEKIENDESYEEDDYFEEDEFEEDEYEDDYFEDKYDTDVMDDSQEYVLANSDWQEVQEKQLYELTAEECRIARNEIYARHGRIFSDESLQAYFENCSWYEGTTLPEEFSDTVLNEVEKANLQIIAEHEREMGYR